MVSIDQHAHDDAADHRPEVDQNDRQRCGDVACSQAFGVGWQVDGREEEPECLDYVAQFVDDEHPLAQEAQVEWADGGGPRDGDSGVEEVEQRSSQDEQSNGPDSKGGLVAVGIYEPLQSDWQDDAAEAGSRLFG